MQSRAENLRSSRTYGNSCGTHTLAQVYTHSSPTPFIADIKGGPLLMGEGEASDSRQPVGQDEVNPICGRGWGPYLLKSRVPLSNSHSPCACGPSNDVTRHHVVTDFTQTTEIQTTE